MIAHVDDHERSFRRRSRNIAPSGPDTAAEEPHHRLLGLQRKIGNAAVTQIVQRESKAASTDAPWAKHHPKSKPPANKAPDVHARIIGLMIVNDRTRITIGSGPEQGVKVGMPGSVVYPSGREAADFTIDEAEGRVSKAFVDLIPDQIHEARQVVIKASRFTPESMEGKEF
jgi:hypothetical protein